MGRARLRPAMTEQPGPRMPAPPTNVKTPIVAPGRSVSGPGTPRRRTARNLAPRGPLTSRRYLAGAG